MEGSLKDVNSGTNGFNEAEQRENNFISKPHRQHPAAIFTFLLRTLREMIVPIVLIFFLGQGGNSPFFSWQGITLMLLVLLALGFTSWLRFTWRVEDDELRIEQGLFVRKKRYLPRDRIQVIDISSGPVQRLFGLVRLNVLTAGGSAPEAGISAISVSDAQAIAEALKVRARNEEAGEATAQDDISWPEYKLSRKRLVIAASTAGSFGIALSIVGTVIAQINQVVNEDQIINWLETYAAGITPDIWISLIVVAVLIAWLLSVFGTLLRYSGFTLTRNDRELHINRGLFEKKQITIPFHRIQAVRVVEGILRQPLGLAMVYVENAGFGDEGGKTTVVSPLIRKRELEKFMKEMLTDFDVQLPGVKPPGRAFLRYQIKVLVPAIILASALSWYFGVIWVIPVIGIAAGISGFIRYRDAAAGFDDEHGFMRFRRFARTTVLFHRRHVQSLSILSNWFQRRKKLCSVSVSVASGSGGAIFRVDHLDVSSSSEWHAWYGEQRRVVFPSESHGNWPDWKPASEPG